MHPWSELATGLNNKICRKRKHPETYQGVSIMDSTDRRKRDADGPDDGNRSVQPIQRPS